MGRLAVRHYVEITTEKGKAKIACSCGWREANKKRTEAFALAHLHIANAAVSEQSV